MICDCGAGEAAVELQNLRKNQSDLLKQHADDTRQFADLIMKQHHYAGIINRLANTILDTKDASDNDRYEAEQAIELVRPLL